MWTLNGAQEGRVLIAPNPSLYRILFGAEFVLFWTRLPIPLFGSDAAPSLSGAGTFRCRVLLGPALWIPAASQRTLNYGSALE